MLNFSLKLKDSDLITLQNKIFSGLELSFGQNSGGWQVRALIAQGVRSLVLRMRGAIANDMI